MGKLTKKIVEFIEKTINAMEIEEIFSEVEEYIKDELNSGDIVEVIETHIIRKGWSCPPGYPSEYYSKEFYEESYTVKTSTGDIYIIEQGHYGLNFERPCDRTEYSIYNENKKLLFSTYPSKQEELKNKSNQKELLINKNTMI